MKISDKQIDNALKIYLGDYETITKEMAERALSTLLSSHFKSGDMEHLIFWLSVILVLWGGGMGTPTFTPGIYTYPVLGKRPNWKSKKVFS